MIYIIKNYYVENLKFPCGNGRERKENVGMYEEHNTEKRLKNLQLNQKIVDKVKKKETGQNSATSLQTVVSFSCYHNFIQESF